MTTLVNDLDRERKDEYWMEVVATDRGVRPRLSGWLEGGDSGLKMNVSEIV